MATADTTGSTMQVKKLMGSLTETVADLTPAGKQAQLVAWLNQDNTMLITNQPLPADVQPTITVAVGDQPVNADIHVATVTDLRKLWDTTEALFSTDTKVLRWTSVVMVLFLLLAAGLGISISPYFFVAPVVATILRLALSLTLLTVVDPES